MRDLEIRGAGNILGQQQHRHLVATGFELSYPSTGPSQRSASCHPGAAPLAGFPAT